MSLLPRDASQLAPSIALGAFSCALAVIFVPGFADSAVNPRWALLSVGVPILIAFYARGYARLTTGHCLGIAFLSWAALSLIWTPSIYEGLDALWKLALLAALFQTGFQISTLRPVFIGLGLGMAINSGLVTAQWLGHEPVPTLTGHSGLFMNKNYLAEPAALVLVGLVAYRLWWLVPGVIPAVVIPGARGAILALAAAATAGLWRWSRTAAVVCVVGAGGCLLAIHAAPGSLAERAAIWIDTGRGMTWHGSGAGSFYIRFPSHADTHNLMTSRPAHAHNDFLELAYEYGPGAIPALALCVLGLVGAWGAAHFVLAAFLVESAVGFPLHFPVTAFIAALALGHVYRGWSDLCGVLDARGMALRNRIRALARRACGLDAPRRRPLHFPT